MKSYSVVVIDDEPMIVSVIKSQLLRHFGSEFEIETATSVDKGLELIAELRESDMEVPLVICDYLMPGSKGDDLIIKLHQQYPEILSVLLTGQVDVEAMGNIVNHAKLFRYMAKPWDEMDLVLTVREAANSYTMAKVLEKQDKQISGYAFTNAHTVRGPLARILGLISLIKYDPSVLQEENFLEKLEVSAQELDEVIRSISTSLE